DSSGNFEWARSWGGSGWDQGFGVATDGSGNVYVTGDFSSIVDFDPDGGDPHTTNAYRDVFLSKFDSSGNFEWARTWGGSGTDHGFGVAADGSGNIYVTGIFWKTVDFNPNGGDPHISNGHFDVFLSKFDSSGNFKGARTWGGSDEDYGNGVAADGSGNVYVTGYFMDTVDFDPGGGDPHTSNGSRDAFLSKFDSSGIFVWARIWGGSSDDRGRGIAIDGSEKVYVTGYFRSTVDFNPDGGDPHTSNGEWDVFLSKFDTLGNFEWARTWGGSEWDRGYGIAADGFGNVFVTGDFFYTVDFNPEGGDPHTSNGYIDVFLSKFDSLGNFDWARTWGGSFLDEGFGVAADGSGNVYVIGDFDFIVDFAPTDPPCNEDPDEHTSNGDLDVSLTKYLPDGCW
ncbi:SBBP repeat-containing protein, partial [bacterium]|nr:SBBP repeat-containing protein [bacterium]